MAIAAAPAVDELFLERRNIELDRAAKQRIETLERDGLDMRGVQGLERREVRGDASCDADSLEILIQTKLVRHVLPPSYASLTQSNGVPGRCKTDASIWR